MPDDESDLNLVQKVPHLNFLMELFINNRSRKIWSQRRIARFKRVKGLLLRCWDNAHAQMRQMAGNAAFQNMFRLLKKARVRLMKAEELIRNSPRELTGFFDLMTAKPAGEGVRLS